MDTSLFESKAQILMYFSFYYMYIILLGWTR